MARKVIVTPAEALKLIIVVFQEPQRNSINAINAKIAGLGVKNAKLLLKKTKRLPLQKVRNV